MNDPISPGLATTPASLIQLALWIAAIAALIIFFSKRKDRQRNPSTGACNACGTVSDADARYCASCGADLSGRVRPWEWLLGVLAIFGLQLLVGMVFLSM
jgi:ribosomal protein L37E